jgi:Fe-S cluster assembly protein SufD
MSELLNSTEIKLINANGFESVLNDNLKTKASEVLETIQFPTTRTEAWKYTRLTKISKNQFNVCKSTLNSIEDFKIAKDAYTFVFLNGFYTPELSSKELSENIIVQTLDKIDAFVLGKNITLENEIFNALNTRFSTGGIAITVKKNAVIDLPIQILHITEGEKTCATTRNIIIAEDNSQSNFIEAFHSYNAENTLENSITEVFVGKNTHLHIDKIQVQNDTCYHISTEQVEQDKDSTFTINTVTLNGGLIRNNLNIDVIGENCTTNLNGIYQLKGQQHVDNHTKVDHIVPNCQSNELYKGIIDEKGTAVFNGKVFVRRNAQKINAFQSNGNVLLSDDATVNSKPELEIYADDVKCSHGSTTGQLDEEAVFYLRARGLSEKSARKLIVGAFINDVIEKIENEEVVTYVQQKIEERFSNTK